VGPFGVSSFPDGSPCRPKTTRRASHEVPCSSESYYPRSVPAIRFAGPPFGVFRPWGLPSRDVPRPLNAVRFILSRASAFHRDPNRVPPIRVRRAEARTSAIGILPWGSLSPPASPTRRVGVMPRFHPKRLPPRPFSGPRGFDPHRAWQPCLMLHPLMGFRSSRRFPATDVPGARHPRIPSRRFPRF
jgi:hypothetical protein